MQKKLFKKGSDHFVSQDAAVKKQTEFLKAFLKTSVLEKSEKLISQTGMVCIGQSRLQAEKSQLLFINIKLTNFLFIV